jgi:succinate dehydrogenase / fumarate reductase membrane anchor subunit
VVKRVVVGAHYGVRGWLAQRVSAAAMAACTLVFTALLLSGGPFTFASWKALFASGWMRSTTFVFVVSVLIHAWVGVREILMDYAKPAGLRFALEVATVLVLAGYAGWAMQILWRL